MTGTRRRRLAVVIADDNAEIRDMLAAILEEDGFRTATASNGADAVALVESMSPDVVVMDLSMPVLDGLEATRRIRHELGNTTVAVIALTALEAPSTRRHAYAAGCTAFVVKPVEPEDLIAVIDEVLAARGRAAQS